MITPKNFFTHCARHNLLYSAPSLSLNPGYAPALPKFGNYFPLFVVTTYTGGGGGGAAPIGAVSRAATRVKMQSRHFLGIGQMVKQCARALTIYSTTGNQEAWPSFCTCTLNQWSRVKGKIQHGEVVKVIFRRSKILIPVTALDMAPV